VAARPQVAGEFSDEDLLIEDAMKSTAMNLAWGQCIAARFNLVGKSGHRHDAVSAQTGSDQPDPRPTSRISRSVRPSLSMQPVMTSA
jgi:hypothetical protein